MRLHKTLVAELRGVIWEPSARPGSPVTPTALGVNLDVLYLMQRWWDFRLRTEGTGTNVQRQRSVWQSQHQGKGWGGQR